MSSTTFNDSNFKTVFQEQFELTMVQSAQSLVDKYYTEAYTIYQVHLIDDMILKVLPYSMSSINGKRYDLRKMCWKKSSWMSCMKVITKSVVDKVSKRKCNDCKKMWCDCRNTCIKLKTNPRPIEFPQDVFNVIKDYMDIVDVPTPVWNEMMSKSIKEISTHRKYKGTGPDYYKPFPEGTNLRKVKVAEKKQRYFVGIIKQAKKRAVEYYDHMKYMGTYNEEGRHFYGRWWIKACECNASKWSRCHGPIRAYVGWEATDYTMIVNERIRDLVGNEFPLGITSMREEQTNMCVCV
jgi:hypothetical protein